MFIYLVQAAERFVAAVWPRCPAHPKARFRPAASITIVFAVITQELAVCICQRRLPKRATLFLGSKITYGVRLRERPQMRIRTTQPNACLPPHYIYVLVYNTLTESSLKGRSNCGGGCNSHFIEHWASQNRINCPSARNLPRYIIIYVFGNASRKNSWCGEFFAASFIILVNHAEIDLNCVNSYRYGGRNCILFHFLLQNQFFAPISFETRSGLIL